MRTCPICGFHHLDSDALCIRCGAALVHDRQAAEFAGRRADRPALAASAGRALDNFYRVRGRVARGVDRLRRVFEFPLRRDVEPRAPFAAAALSLLPGAGQLYNYQPRKAALFAVVWVLLIILAAATFFHPRSNLALGLLLLWAVYAFHDGFRTARRMRDTFWHTRLSLGFFTAWIFLLCAGLLFAQFLLGISVVKLRHMSEPALRPTIEQGDRFAVDLLTYRLREPRVGDVVYYRPRQIVLDQGQNMYIEAPLNGLERIVAGPGETFERRGGRFFRNGQAAPEEEAPLNTREVLWDYRLEAPPGTFIVIRSYTAADSLGAAAPRMNEVRAVMGWEEACLVTRDAIIGRVAFIYNPPTHRRWF